MGGAASAAPLIRLNRFMAASVKLRKYTFSTKLTHFTQDTVGCVWGGRQIPQKDSLLLNLLFETDHVSKGWHWVPHAERERESPGASDLMVTSLGLKQWTHGARTLFINLQNLLNALVPTSTCLSEWCQRRIPLFPLLKNSRHLCLTSNRK